MELKRLLFSLIAIALLVTCMTSCDKDDEETRNGIDLNFRLLNANGEEQSTFKSGDNIYFDLTIVNNCDTKMIYTFEEWNDKVIKSGICENGADMFLPSAEELFCVYDESGKEVGVPYGGMFCQYSAQTWMTIEAHSTSHLRCAWKETGRSEDITYPICGSSNMPDLSIGKYKVSFRIKYRNKANSPKSDFKTVVFNSNFSVE